MLLAVLVVVGLALVSIAGAGVAAYLVYRRASAEVTAQEERVRDERTRVRSIPPIGIRQSPIEVAPSPVVPPVAVASVHDPRVVETVKRDDYKLTGSSESDLRHEMDVEGPVDHSTHFDAHTNWYLKWSYPFDNSSGQCATGPVTVSLEITYQLPEWDGDPSAPPALTDKWRRYEQALQAHEDGHAEHGRDAADEVERTLTALPPASDCPTMDRIANAKAQAIIDAHAQDDVAYDRDTQHGATQGARFP